jgi:hypothetical protein
MAARSSNLSLALGLALSIALHLMVLVPMLLMAMTTTKPLPSMQADLPPEEAASLDERSETPEPKLGMDAGTPSTITWIGYEEYKEHLAQRAEIEQAAFTRDPSGAMGDADDVAPDRSDDASVVVDEVKIAEAADARERVFEEVETVMLPVPSLTLPTIDPSELRESLVESAVEPDGVLPILSESDAVASDSVEAVEVVEGERETASGEREIDAEKDEQVDAVETVDGDEAPSPSRDAPAGDVRDGEQAEKDADATGIIDVSRENWRLGRPLAARGVEIRPERPHFTLLQRATVAPRNPIVVIRFNRRGIPDQAAILRGSGNASIDAAILASLYRWRANGNAIDELGEKQTFDIEIRIVLVQHRYAD